MTGPGSPAAKSGSPVTGPDRPATRPNHPATRTVRTVRRQITLPFLVVALAVPLAALLIFNIGMRIYLLQTARSELRASAGVADTLIRQQAAEDAAAGDATTLSEKVRDRLDSVRALVKASRLAYTSDLLVMDRSGRLLLPASAAAAGIAPATLQRIEGRLDKDPAAAAATARIQSIWTRQGHYLFIGLPLVRKSERSPTLVFYTRVSYFSGYMLFINLLLLALFLAGAMVSMLIARRTAAAIELPLQKLNAFAERIGHGDFTPLPDRAAAPAGGRRGQSGIHELTELTERMNRMADRLAHADSLQKTFLQNASHELRTPLMAIQGYAEGLASGVIQDTPRAAAIIRDESLRLKRLVEELLTLSRIENRTGRLALEPASLTDRVRETVSHLEAAAVREGRQIRLESGPEAIPVLLDDDLLSQVLTNLVGNAIRYATTAVTVQVFLDGREAVVRVADDGPGIAESALPHLFERFFKGSGGQFGLGLAIAASAASALQGRLTAANRQPGPGAVFELRLPAADQTSGS